MEVPEYFEIWKNEPREGETVNPKAPTHRVAGNFNGVYTDFAACWPKTAKNDAKYLSCSRKKDFPDTSKPQGSTDPEKRDINNKEIDW